MAQGSIPWVVVALIVLFQIALLRLAGLGLSARASRTEEAPMRQEAHVLRLFGLSMLDTVWAIEAGSAAGALPA